MAVQPAGPNAWNLPQPKKNKAATTNKSHSNSPATPRRRPPALRMEYLALAVVALAWLYYAAFKVFSWMGGGDRGGGASPAGFPSLSALVLCGAFAWLSVRVLQPTVPNAWNFPRKKNKTAEKEAPPVRGDVLALAVVALACVYYAAFNLLSWMSDPTEAQ